MSPASAITAANIRLMLHSEQIKVANGYCLLPDGSNALSKYVDEGLEAFPLLGLVYHFIYQEEKRLTMRSRF